MYKRQAISHLGVRKAALSAASAAQAIHTEAEASAMLASETAILSREPKAKRDRIASIAQSSHSKATHTENLTIEAIKAASASARAALILDAAYKASFAAALATGAEASGRQSSEYYEQMRAEADEILSPGCLNHVKGLAEAAISKAHSAARLADEAEHSRHTTPNTPCLLYTSPSPRD